MTLVKFNPEKKNNVLLPGFNDIFESVLEDNFFSSRRMSNVPSVNISDSPDAYHIELAAPGLRKEDFKVNVERDMLTISTEKKTESSEGDKSYTRREFNYAAFTRSFTLPESADVDRIQASYQEGVLKLHLPKKEEAKAISRQIEIR
ncbi:Hsp20/alpha crystallin family protein [Pedobacter sp. CFBP9032]|uniref:Hsp20/alpha crystallin family protein n=1 Tax=Pedobacter sp. CFBP9032 TaxID=3096539 RepID=UPI002A6A1034|nr:Hsp20/alpha crystallin family protein [Pedobacter sp. CFBP9032]MDY0904972.1 Hsp20/alpha crystallin family protein [Pedobacter sp. CFBP9032]